MRARNVIYTALKNIFPLPTETSEKRRGKSIRNFSLPTKRRWAKFSTSSSKFAIKWAKTWALKILSSSVICSRAVAEFRRQVEEVLVPFCSKLYEAQAKRIGVEEIECYDEEFIFPDGNAVPVGNRPYLVEQAKKMYRDMSRETGEFIDFMLGHELMDLDNKPNKASTGYMTYLADYKAPFVFSCFNGTTGDVDVLTHEMGHAFAGYMAMRTQPLMAEWSESTDIAEIHSMSMEQFAYPYSISSIRSPI